MSKRPGSGMQAPPSCLKEMTPMALPPTLEEGVLAFTLFVHSFIPQTTLGPLPCVW